MVCCEGEIRSWRWCSAAEGYSGEAVQHRGQLRGQKQKLCTAVSSSPLTSSSRGASSCCDAEPHMWTLLWNEVSAETSAVGVCSLPFLPLFATVIGVNAGMETFAGVKVGLTFRPSIVKLN